MSAPTYFTVQMSDAFPGGRHCIHLGQDTDTGGLGDNICRNSRHAFDPLTGNSYGFSANGGGFTDPVAFACKRCLYVFGRNPGVVRGIFKHLFATPKPEEPTGLGAVVETLHGEHYVRDKTSTTVAHWKRAAGCEGGKRHRYSDLQVVRVLSPGVEVDQ